MFMPQQNPLEELQQEIKNLRTQLNHLETNILKENLKTTQTAHTQIQLQQHATQLQDELDETLQKITNPQCKNQPQCLQRFKTLATENIQLIRNQNIQEALSDLDNKIAAMEQTIQKAKGTNCECCHQYFQKRLRSEKRALQTIVLVEKPLDPQAADPDIDGIVTDVLEPLANAARLKILFSTIEGKKSFSRLSQLSGLRGGHLIFHLKKLIDAGFIAQEENKGDYYITQRGLIIAQKTLNLKK